MKCHWMKPFLDESVVDELVICLDESVFGRKCFWMILFSNLVESVPNQKSKQSIHYI